MPKGCSIYRPSELALPLIHDILRLAKFDTDQFAQLKGFTTLLKYIETKYVGFGYRSNCTGIVSDQDPEEIKKVNLNQKNFDNKETASVRYIFRDDEGMANPDVLNAWILSKTKFELAELYYNRFARIEVCCPLEESASVSLKLSQNVYVYLSREKEDNKLTPEKSTEIQ